jgi:hypothetical protein
LGDSFKLTMRVGLEDFRRAVGFMVDFADEAIARWSMEAVGMQRFVLLAD